MWPSGKGNGAKKGNNEREESGAICDGPDNVLFLDGASAASRP